MIASYNLHVQTVVGRTEAAALKHYLWASLKHLADHCWKQDAKLDGPLA